MKLRTALRLGRVSNLPTVWSNTLAGAVLAGASVVPRPAPTTTSTRQIPITTGLSTFPLWFQS